MTKIFYFSATGNSLYVAQVLQKNLNGAEIFSPKTRRRKPLALAMGRKAAHNSFLFDFFILVYYNLKYRGNGYGAS